MSWADIRGLMADGWHIGAHTVTHPNLSDLVADDPEVRGRCHSNKNCPEAPGD
jgi:peptidoglycan/xylan/chitin deacetylase (PgdA/CDA1 family)